MAMKQINPVVMARDACAAMTEPQRIAFAIELTCAAHEPSSAFHLVRLSRAAEAAATDLARADFEKECG